MKFQYADVHGNLKFILITPVKNRYVIDFKTEEDITNLLSSLGLKTDLVDEDYREHRNEIYNIFKKDKLKWTDSNWTLKRHDEPKEFDNPSTYCDYKNSMKTLSEMFTMAQIFYIWTLTLFLTILMTSHIAITIICKVWHYKYYRNTFENSCIKNY